MKKCKICDINKDLSEFRKSKRHKDGVLKECRKCSSEISQKRRTVQLEENKTNYEKFKFVKTSKCTKCNETKLYNEFYFFNCKKTITSACKSCTINKVKEYRENNSDEINRKKRIYSKKYYKEVMDDDQRKKRIKYTKKWRLNNPEHIKEYNKNYKYENRGLCKQIANKRRKILEVAQPKWINEKDIITVYQNSPEGCHVDHIVPLVHPDVCGLHVPWNLQYLEAQLNLNKNNKFDGTLENESWRFDEKEE